ncbi:MAG: Orotate phosphoribosyltransferase, partial [uncultured Solirubrobacteraceae bacterium]
DRARRPHRPAPPARPRDRRGDPDLRRDGAVLRRRQAGDPPAGGLPRPLRARRSEGARVGRDRGGRPHHGRRRPRLRGPRGRRGGQGVLRAQGRQGARAAAPDRGPAAERRRALPDRGGRRDERRLDPPGHRGGPRRGPRGGRRGLHPRPPRGRRRAHPGRDRQGALRGPRDDRRRLSRPTRPGL